GAAGGGGGGGGGRAAAGGAPRAPPAGAGGGARPPGGGERPAPPAPANVDAAEKGVQIGEAEIDGQDALDPTGSICDRHRRGDALNALGERVGRRPRQAAAGGHRAPVPVAGPRVIWLGERRGPRANRSRGRPVHAP